MKKKPEVTINSISLFCPDCGEELTADICVKCGCEIDTEEIMVDIQVEEILNG